MPLRFWLAGGAAIALLVGCGPGSSTADPSPSGVGVITSGCGLTDTSGSGVVVATSGQVVTVAHTLRGATDVVVIDADGVEHPASVVAFDKDLDLAVLTVPSLEAPPLPLGRVATGPGTALVWSRDDGIRQFELDITKRLAVTIEDIYGEGEVRRAAIEVVAEIQVGDSGGPILNSSNEVVGVIYATSRQRDAVGFAVDATEIADVLGRVDDEGADTGRCP